MTHRCESCNYETDDKSNYTRHCKSKSHIDKSNEQKMFDSKLAEISPELAEISLNKSNEQTKKFVCGKCGKDFKHGSSLSKHRKICKSNETQLMIPLSEHENKIKLIENEAKMKLIEQENKLLKEQMKDKESFKSL